RIATMSGCCSIGRVGVAMTNLPIDVLPPPELPRSRAINQRRGVPYATRKTPAPRASTAALTRHGLGRGSPGRLCQAAPAAPALAPATGAPVGPRAPAGAPC